MTTSSETTTFQAGSSARKLSLPLPIILGSLIGVGLATLPGLLVFAIVFGNGVSIGFGPVVLFPGSLDLTIPVDPILAWHFLVAFALASLGVAFAGRIVRDQPQQPAKVVIDKISGQHLTFLVAGFLPYVVFAPNRLAGAHPLSFFGAFTNWNLFLLGGVFFCAFALWKPWPIRAVGKLPRGWGIMADDWIAAIYAAVCLWAARIAIM